MSKGKIRGSGEGMVVEASASVALGAKMCRPKVVPLYPITPQTHIVEHITEYVNNGEMEAELIHVESEHSALSALVGAAAAGVRTFTATASQGLALMYEILPIVSGMRLPTVMAVANRALSAPINIWNDHSDSVSARDQGWIQLYVESSQEAMDTTIMGYNISEDKGVLMPVMVCLDGFTLSHVYEPVNVPSQSEVDKFVPKFKGTDILDVKKPKSFGPIGFPSVFMELKEQQEIAMQNALEVVESVNSDFGNAFGRKYGDGLIEEYQMKDAEYAVLAMGSVCGTARVVVDKMRKKGMKAGLVKLKCLRPFPSEKLGKVVKGLKGLAVLDKHISLGYEGPLFTDVRSALCRSGLHLSNYIVGLGGKDVKVKHIERVFDDLQKGKAGAWLF